MIDNAKALFPQPDTQTVVTRAASLGNCGVGYARTAASSHLWLYLSETTAWHWGQKWALGGGRVKGWWQRRRRRGGAAGWRGEKGAKSHLELYAFPSLSPIQINWIYAAIVWLKPRTPAASTLPQRKSVTSHPQGQNQHFLSTCPGLANPTALAAYDAHVWCFETSFESSSTDNLWHKTNMMMMKMWNNTKEIINCVTCVAPIWY